MTLPHLLPLTANGGELVWNLRWIICVGPSQNFMPATLNWRRQFSSNNHLCISIFVFWSHPMRSPLIAAALGLLLLADVAHAQTLKATSNIIVRASARTIDFTSDTTTSIRDSKVVREAHDDAASFVASNGEIRGAQLEAAFDTLRTRVPEARDASDQVLAEAILSL
jgi:uncharacterized protein (TIGR02448 family)